MIRMGVHDLKNWQPAQTCIENKNIGGKTYLSIYYAAETLT